MGQCRHECWHAVGDEQTKIVFDIALISLEPKTNWETHGTDGDERNYEILNPSVKHTQIIQTDPLVFWFFFIAKKNETIFFIQQQQQQQQKGLYTKNPAMIY